MNKGEEGEALPEAEQMAKPGGPDELKVAAEKMMIAINIKLLEATPPPAGMTEELCQAYEDLETRWKVLLFKCDEHNLG